jgi:Flp pilus assembly protein TadB
MKRVLLLSSIVLVLGFVVVSAHAQSNRVSYIEYKFNDLDENTRAAITKFNTHLSKFSEGCIDEQDKLTFSLLDALAADATCGIATATALKTKLPLTTATAVIACGIQIPKVLRERAEKKENLKTCKELDEMLFKYKKYCEHKTRVVFAFDDSLYCYSPVDGLSLVILDLKSRSVLIKKP